MFVRLLIALALIGSGGAAFGTVIVEDFNYPDNNAVLSGLGGGSGWSGAWGLGGTATIKVSTGANLSSSLYNVSQSGTGRAYGTHPEFRAISRNFTSSLSGTVWFSVLLQNNSDITHAGLQFNNPLGGTAYSTTDFEFDLAGDTLNVKYNGTTSEAKTNLALEETHLVVGKWDVGVGNDTLQLWVDPASLPSLGTADFTDNSGDVGNELLRVGVLAYNTDSVTKPTGGLIDALRISDGGGDSDQGFLDVTGVPEPGTLVLAVLALLAGAFAWIRRRR